MYIDPLLTAYENKIQKLEGIIESLSKDVKHMEESTQLLYTDNESLR